MTHHFDMDIAVKYGVNQAIIFNSIAYWVHCFEATNEHCFDGRYWVYNSKPAWAKLFPYLSERAISYALDKLKGQGLIESACYNSNKYDRTLWYTLTEKGQAEYYKEPLPESANSVNVSNNNGNSIGTNLSDRSIQNCPTYTIINNNINNNISCSEQSSFALLLKDGTEYHVPCDMIEDFKRTYPDKDVEDELRRMAMWLKCNPAKAKTQAGIKRFINSWLSKKDTFSPPQVPRTPPLKEEKPMDYSDWKL